MKTHRLIAAALMALLAGCNKQDAKSNALEAERQKLEAERAALTTEKARLEAEKELTDQKIATEAEARRIEAERVKLEAEKQKLAAEQEQARRAAEQARQTVEQNAAMTEAEKAAQREAAARTAEQQATLNAALARGTEERRKIEILRAQAEHERLAAERATAEARARETAVRRVEADVALQNTSALFFDALAEHGEWFDSDRYGYVWRPHRATIQQHWRPYADGRWQWTDHGWTWQSNESYGWAVYHYGRWARVPRLGWLWVPGHDWAPAWVAWRVKGTEYVGWAPLPPEAQNAQGYGPTVDDQLDLGPRRYAFLAVKELDEHTYLGKFVPPDRQMEILRSSRNVTSITFRQGRGGGGMFVCGGPDSSALNSAIREARNQPEARPFESINVSLITHPSARPLADVVEAGALMLYAPRLAKAPPTAKPGTVREKLAVGEPDRGWSSEAPDEQLWRATVKREADEFTRARQAALQTRPPASRAPVAVNTPAKPTPTPTPKPVVRQPPPPKKNPLNPARLQPGSPLFGNP